MPRFTDPKSKDNCRSTCCVPRCGVENCSRRRCTPFIQITGAPTLRREPLSGSYCGKQKTAYEISSRRKQLAGTIVCWCRFKTLAQLHSKTDINLGTEIESEKWVGRFTR